MKRFTVFALSLLFSSLMFAETFINTVGSDDRTAISGFDSVAFYTDKKAVLGKPEFAFNYLDAKWVFASQENLTLFQNNPDKYMPAWGGQCAWAVSENTLSKKKLSGSFDIIGGKLYLFAHGNESSDGARNGFWQTGGGSSRRISNGNAHWFDIEKKLVDGDIVQPTAKNYRKTKFD
jgi:YHS domain-containing protein